MFNSVVTIQSVEYENHSMVTRQEEDKRMRFALSNTNIGQILTESSREIDKINKMLEEHRRKKAMKYENSPIESEKNHNSDQYYDEQQPNSAKESTFIS